jgi:hypothetical protein
VGRRPRLLLRLLRLLRLLLLQQQQRVFVSSFRVRTWELPLLCLIGWLPQKRTKVVVCLLVAFGLGFLVACAFPRSFLTGIPTHTKAR